MIYATIAQALIILLLLIMFEREAQREIAKDAIHARERKSLLDRIQHPERIQVQTDPDYVTPDAPKDAAELAAVGTIVPDFIQVGGDE